MRAPTSRLLRGTLAAALAAGALLAGCGDDGGGGGGSTATQDPTSQGGPPVVAVQTATPGFNPVEIYKKAAPGVVTIRSVFDSGGELFSGGAAEGSGFVLNSDGEIVTNAHVVTEGNGANRTQADEVYVQFADRNNVPAEIVGFDPYSDVALLQVEPDGLDLQPLELGDDRPLVPGMPVAAIGSPFSQESSLSTGVVSATDRPVQSLTDFQIDNAIQTDAAINPGNSGGPLLDAQARVLGINQQIQTESGANDGVGFAVPVTAIKRSVEQLRESGDVSYAYIGVSTQDVYPQLNEKLDLGTDFGAIIQTVQPDSPAEEAGLSRGEETVTFQANRYRVGDVITAVNGKKVVDASDLASAILDLKPGDKITMTVYRDGEPRDIDVTLAERPDVLQAG